MRDWVQAAIEVGASIGIVLAVVGTGQLVIRLAAARRLAENPNDVNAKAVLLLF